MTLAKEGWGICATVAIFTIVLTFIVGFDGAWWSWLALAFVLQFFREPNRLINQTPDVVLSPADGRVVFVGQAPSPVDNQTTIKISVFMNVFNVHVNRAPISGQIIQSQRFPGRFFNAALDKASHDNERHLITLRTDCGDISCVQIAGLLARRVFCYAHVDDILTVGQRYGFIRFGSRVDVYLPISCQPVVAIGDRVHAGTDLIAHIIKKEQPSEKAT